MKPEWLDASVSLWARVGSRETCDPPPTDTDEDFLVYDRWFYQRSKLQGLGWKNCGDYRGDTKFTAWRKGELNVICVSDKKYYDKFIEASSLAKKLNLLIKQQRIDLFEHIMKE
jgi:hypothetical protein